MPQHNGGGRPSTFVEVDKLKNADGLVAIISKRRSNGTYTFGIFKEFDRDGGTERTAFIPELLFASYRALVDLAIERVSRLRASEK